MKPASIQDLASVAVVIPCFRSADTIESVVAGIPEAVGRIVCVNDCSDDDTADVLKRLAERDRRVCVISRSRNGGVGAATVTGYFASLAEDVRAIVKIDSDGQMNAKFIPSLVEPILGGEADYVKGNRFFDIDGVRAMPIPRLLGNAGLSFLTKLSTGYWDLFDPTNGFTAIQSDVARALPLHKLHPRFFFESDMLFRLSSLRAKIVELPIETRYGEETSHLSEWNALLTFPFLHARNFLKRIVYNYFLRGFSAASLSLLAGLILSAFGLIFGIDAWVDSAHTSTPATAGTVMLSAIPLLVGFQLLLSFLQHDVSTTPTTPIHPRISYFLIVHSQKVETEKTEC